MALKLKNVIFLDLQTTGAKPDTAHILEMAWSFLHGEAVHSQTVRLPNEELVPKRIQFITGIKDDVMLASKSLPEVLADFKESLKNLNEEKPIAIIHFAQFERPFLMDAFAKIGEELPFQILCTHEIAKRLFPNLPTRGIKGLAGYFGCPSGELKRAEGHVQATQVIWQGLMAALEEKGLTSFEAIHEWLAETPKATRGKYEYPLPKEKRLSLPKQPGVYRMLSRWGEILYVGKATSLHDRVNSYFRGQKNRDSKKLEMLTQVWDLRVTVVGSPLESALLETDEIKKWNPPYNISLKVGRRELAFFNRDFTSMRNQADEEHVIGPFSNAMALDSILRLSLSLRSPSFDEQMFYEPIDSELLKSGFQLFCERHGFEPETFASVRSILAVGLNWYRQLADEAEETLEEDLTDASEASELLDEPTISRDKPQLTEDLEINDPDEEVELTPEDLADKFERHFIRSAATYLRTKKLTSLLNAEIEIDTKNKIFLRTRNGQVVSELNPDGDRLLNPWQDSSIDTYDRMTVLFTELNKLKDKDHDVRISLR